MRSSWFQLSIFFVLGMVTLAGCQPAADTLRQHERAAQADDTDGGDRRINRAVESEDGGTASENPVVRPGKSEPDGKLGSFTQYRSFDCFFLSSVIALANDPDGRALIETGIQPTNDPGNWEITFANQKNAPVVVTQQQLAEHRLADARRSMVAEPVAGDPDVQMLEIAADRIWKDIKPEGLWDDVPMNALVMFTDARQVLIWNRSRASAVAARDVDKYRRLPSQMVHEVQAESPREAERLLAEIVERDTDGISMAMLDYEKYHAIAIVEIDLEGRTYKYIDPGQQSTRILDGDLETLFHGVANGIYAVNYVEVEQSDHRDSAAQ